MKFYNQQLSKSMFSLNLFTKKTIAITVDILICFFAFWFAIYLRLEEFILFKDLNLTPILFSILIVIPIFWIFGLYKTLFRYAGLSIFFNISAASLVYGVIYFLIIGIFGIQGTPRSIGIIQPILLFLGVISSRFLIKYLLTGTFKASRDIKNRENIMIYGAGSAGRQLLVSLENNPKYKVIGFLDDNPQLQKQILFGKKIYDLSTLEDLNQFNDVKLILFAIPSISKLKKKQIIKKLNEHKIIVKTLPSISEIIDEKITISDIKDLNVEDLLDRDEVKPDVKLLSKNIISKTVLVTGAGGSIGSELSRQIIRLKPHKLLILELNEFVLYKIYEELKTLNKNLKIIPLLVNVQDQKKLETIFETFKVDTIYHAAAYKHVPLVEENICEGVKNNVFSTLAVAKASVIKKVSNLVLISSDKAVRPTNIMGASKRLSELCMQGIHYHTKNINTNFSIVRFGNVLESSGSVIPKFKKQIMEGGPVTLTHKDVTRYFMTTIEAAQLVIQAGAMGKNSEVFVLDMGESVKIKELIYKLIKLSGFNIKDEQNPNGDIEVKIIGLRPGEKLYEELLIGDNPQKTNNPKILKISETFIPFDQLENDLNNLKNLLDNNKSKDVKNLLIKILKLYQSNSEIVDHIYTEQLPIIQNRPNISSLKDKDNKVVKIKKF
jgi:FlaA1/EpsC-like NDP-sugar epimerase